MSSENAVASFLVSENLAPRWELSYLSSVGSLRLALVAVATQDDDDGDDGDGRDGDSTDDDVLVGHERSPFCEWVDKECR